MDRGASRDGRPGISSACLPLPHAESQPVQQAARGRAGGPEPGQGRAGGSPGTAFQMAQRLPATQGFLPFDRLQLAFSSFNPPVFEMIQMIWFQFPLIYFILVLYRLETVCLSRGQFSLSFRFNHLPILAALSCLFLAGSVFRTFCF